MNNLCTGNRFQFRVVGGIVIDFSQFRNCFTVLVISFWQKNHELAIPKIKEFFTANPPSSSAVACRQRTITELNIRFKIPHFKRELSAPDVKELTFFWLVVTTFAASFIINLGSYFYLRRAGQGILFVISGRQSHFFANKRTLKFGHIGNWGHWFWIWP